MRFCDRLAPWFWCAAPQPGQACALTCICEPQARQYSICEFTAVFIDQLPTLE
jgi:hypothetical protein